MTGTSLRDDADGERFPGATRSVTSGGRAETGPQDGREGRTGMTGAGGLYPRARMRGRRQGEECTGNSGAPGGVFRDRRAASQAMQCCYLWVASVPRVAPRHTNVGGGEAIGGIIPCF